MAVLPTRKEYNRYGHFFFRLISIPASYRILSERNLEIWLLKWFTFVQRTYQFNIIRTLIMIFK